MQNLSIPAGNFILPAWLHEGATHAAPCLVICHGFCGSPEGGSSFEIAEALQKHNIATLRFGLTPHASLSQLVAEIGAVINYCRTNTSARIALLGRSMGAAASLVFAAANPGLAGLCLMASPADLPATFSGILGEDYTRLENGHPVTVFHENQPVHLTPEFIRDLKKYDLPCAIASLSGLPILLVHGLEDDTVPVEHGRRLYSSASMPKKLLLLPDVKHTFTGMANRFVPELTAWLTNEVFRKHRFENSTAGRCSL